MTVSEKDNAGKNIRIAMHVKTASQQYSFWDNFQLTADDVSAMAYSVSVEKKDPADVARAWMEANKSTVDGWLGL